MLNYKKGDIVRGRVTGIQDYGIFVLVDENITGLVHISEISNYFVKNVSDYANIGDVIKAKVLYYNKYTKKLRLSIKEFEYDNNSVTNGIVESPNGFNGLKEKLPLWIDSKISEIDERMKKIN